MKRLMVALAAATLLVVGTGAVVLAQTPTPWNQGQPGWGCPGWGWGGGSGGGYDPAQNPTLQLLAEKIGIGVKDLAAELQAGKSVAEVAKARDVSEQTLVDALLAPRLEMLEIQVKYGYLTREQADAAKQAMADSVRWQLNQKGYFGGGGWGWGMMGPGHGPGMMGPGYGYGPGMMGRGYGVGPRGPAY